MNLITFKGTIELITKSSDKMIFSLAKNVYNIFFKNVAIQKVIMDANFETLAYLIEEPQEVNELVGDG